MSAAQRAYEKAQREQLAAARLVGGTPGPQPLVETRTWKPITKKPPPEDATVEDEPKKRAVIRATFGTPVEKGRVRIPIMLGAGAGLDGGGVLTAICDVVPRASCTLCFDEGLTFDGKTGCFCVLKRIDRALGIRNAKPPKRRR